MTTVHLVYPCSDKIRCPDAIGRHIVTHLRQQGYRVIVYLWDDWQRINPGDNDVLLGHPHYFPFSIFRRSVKLNRWQRKIAIFPYAHGEANYSAFAENAVRHSDLFLAITGRYWYQTAPHSIFSHWCPKMVHLDLAVDRQHFPVVKHRFNPAGKRRFVYIGHNGGTYKNIPYLAQIAQAMPDVEFNWIGPDYAKKPIAGFHSMGSLDFSTPQGQAAVAQQDFLLTVGSSDPNPTTILESMAWGLVPVCTPQSGYVDYPSIANVPLNDVAGAVKVLRQLIEAPDAQLEEMRHQNWALLDGHFNWARFTRQVQDAIESNRRPALGPVSTGRKARIFAASMWGRTSPLRFYIAASFTYRAIRGKSRSPIAY